MPSNKINQATILVTTPVNNCWRIRQRAILISALAGVTLGQLCAADIRTWATADITSRLSYAGLWTPIDSTATTTGIVPPYWNVVKLGAAQREGVAMGSWVFNGSFGGTLPDVMPVRALLLAQQPDGTLLESTSALLGDSVTNGAGSVIVADFNGDGFDDLVFPAHNESPFLLKSSTAWMSGPGGTLTKLILPDAAMNHDARLVTLNGKKTILSLSFGGRDNSGFNPGFNAVYTWNGTSFTFDKSLGEMGGQSVLAGRFTGNSDDWLIIGDSRNGPGVPYAPTKPMQNYAYKYNNGVVTLPPVLLPKPYFNEKAQYASYQSGWDPASKTHTSRLWTTDLNQDGLPDILCGQEIWTSASPGLQKSVFQLLINKGNMVFEDQTDALASEYSQDAMIDYSVRFVDVDGSGIDTIFHSGGVPPSPAVDAARQGQYILVNDGTGRLYAAMHEEFRAMTAPITNFLRTKVPAGMTVAPATNALTPNFIAYRTPAGLINFMASLGVFGTAPRSTLGLVTVALQINLTTDFQRDLTIPTRNGSRRIRTFAGNDTISRAISDPDCAIDGGLGNNTVIYSGRRSDWLVNRTSAQVKIRPATGPGGTDTLTRIQTAVFSDQTVDLNLVADPADPPRLSNLSTRGLVQPGGALTPGFVVRGSGPKQLLIRGNGPSLAQFNLPGVLADPKLELIPAGSSAAQVSNDNWGTPFGAGALSAAQLTAAFASVGAFSLPPGSKDSAVVSSLMAGNYSARITPTATTDTGIALAEVYDLEPNTSPARLVNVSTLGFAGAGLEALTPGFVIRGSSSKQLLIRAIGPGLSQFGIGGLLADPQLSVIPAGQSAAISGNNDWGGTTALKAAFAAAGAFMLPDNSRDASVVVTLPPGGYSVVVSDVNGALGTALVEVYDLDP